MQINNICKKISLDLGVDQELVKQIVMYQFKFIKDVMVDPEDYHDILLSKLFRFSLKSRFKVDKTKDYKI